MLEVVPLPLNLIASKEEFTRSAVRRRKVFSKRRAGSTRERLFTRELLRLLASQSRDEKRHGKKAEHRLAGDHVDIDTENRNSGRVVGDENTEVKKLSSSSPWPVTQEQSPESAALHKLCAKALLNVLNEFRTHHVKAARYFGVDELPKLEFNPELSTTCIGNDNRFPSPWIWECSLACTARTR